MSLARDLLLLHDIGGPSIITEDFESYGLGTIPSGEWGTLWGNHTMSIADMAGNNVLKFLSGTSSAFIQWLGGGSNKNVDEVYCRAHLASGTSIRLMGRVSGPNNGAMYCYIAELNDSSNEFTLRKVVNGSWAYLGQQAGQTISSGTWYWIRMSMMGTAIKASWGTTLEAAQAGWVHEVSNGEVPDAGKIGCSFGASGASQYAFFDDFTKIVL